MNMKPLQLGKGLLLGVLLTVLRTEASPVIRVTATVVDEAGNPVHGALVGFGGGLNARSPIAPREAEGKTDRQGRFEARIACADGTVSFTAEKEGYYMTEGHVYSGELFQGAPEQTPVLNSVLGREGDFEVVIRKVKNPVPLFVKRYREFLPVLDIPAGFDFEIGDWVSPYGRGKVADVLFSGSAWMRDPTNYSCILTASFPNIGDGIVGSDQPTMKRSHLELPHEAPASGYLSEWKWKTSCITPEGRYATSEMHDDNLKGRGFFLRTRTVLGPDGTVISARYTKFNSPFALEPRKGNTWVVAFAYYHNPTGSRNLEFDPTRNLFKGEREWRP
jgi:hypothetical protein